jgi:hypothetical protein
MNVFIYLFIRSLFNDGVSVADTTGPKASNERAIRDDESESIWKEVVVALF